MFTAKRISKKTFLAAAMLGVASSLLADTWVIDNPTAQSSNEIMGGHLTTTGHGTFVKQGDGWLTMYTLGMTGDRLYGRHDYGHASDNRLHGPYYHVVYGNQVTFEAHINDDAMRGLLHWKSGEVRVEDGILNLVGYVNAWADFGSIINSSMAEGDLGLDNGPKMAGATRVTILDGAELNLNGGAKGSMVGAHIDVGFGNQRPSGGAQIDDVVFGGQHPLGPWFQFLQNLNASKGSYLDLGASEWLDLNIHVDAWNPKATTMTEFGEEFKDTLAFGGTAGHIRGLGDIYKTGGGDLLLQTGSPDFVGALTVAGGALVFGSDNTHLKDFALKSAFGESAKVRVYDMFSNAKAVNLAGTFYDGSDANHNGSRQSLLIGVFEGWGENWVAGQDPLDVSVFVKEAYFTKPDAGTLVVAENQIIRNLQADFNAGYVNEDWSANVATPVGVAIRDAALAENCVADPIIAGTGVGSKIVIPGGIYKKDADGNYTDALIKDSDGYLTGGVLVVNQDAGQGGIYEGSIVGARVKIYNKADFTDDLNAVALSADQIGEDVGLTDEEMAELNFDADGRLALDNAVAQKVVAHYKKDGDYHVGYTADEGVTGGLLYLQGKGDLALLLESANYSGIIIDENREGKTVLNIAALNNITGTVSNLSGYVSIVASQFDTLKVKLDFGADSKLVFSTVDSVDTKSGAILVGNERQAITGVSYKVSEQDQVYGDVYVERGAGLSLSGDTATFPNATSLVLWKGPNAKGEQAAASLALLSNSVQLIQNLTGDSTGSVSIGIGTLVANITNNTADSRSGLPHGTYDGAISGSGTLVKAGSGLLSLGGGENTRLFYGTTEVATGDLAVTKASGLTGSSALILNGGTNVKMTGNQSLRNLFGSSGTTLTVDGTLSLGSNVAPANGEDRTRISANLGTGSVRLNVADTDVSFSRFVGNFDKAGNLLEAPSGPVTQAEWTQEYLTYTSKLAYSGFDVSALETFVTAGVLDENDYNALKDVAANGARNGNLGVGADAKDLYGDLTALYGELAAKKYYSDIFKSKTAEGYYSPIALKSVLGATAYGDFVKGLRDSVEKKYGSEIPANPTDAQKARLNTALFDVLCEKYNEAVTAEFKAVLDKAIADKLTDEEIYAAVSECWIIVVPEIPTPGLPDFLRILEDYKTNAAPDAPVFVTAMRKAGWEIAAKDAIKGIEIVGAFANDVSENGTLVDGAWIDDLAFAGTLTANVLHKTGDNTVTLTGTVNTSKIVVEAGTLATNYNSIATTLKAVEKDAEGKILSETPGSVTIERGASFSLGVAESEEILTLDVNGSGNFIKTGAGKLTLGESVLYTGTTTIKGGTLEMTLRNPMVSEDGTSLAAQGDIYLDGDNVHLILNQDDDYNAVNWERSIEIVGAAVVDVGVTKIGAGELVISGDVRLGKESVLAVEAGTLVLNGGLSLGESSEIAIQEGASLSVASMAAAGSSLRVTGAGALRTTGNVTLIGSSPVPGVFTGTVAVAGGKLTLSGESLFDYAREVRVYGGATLDIAGGQTVRSLSGTEKATVTVESGANLTIIRDSGERVALDYTSGNYSFNEAAFLDAPTYSGKLTGYGTISVIGDTGTQRFSGTDTISAKILVEDGAQLMLDASALAADGLLSAAGKGSEILFVGDGDLSSEIQGAFANGGIFGKIGIGRVTVSSADSVLDGVSQIRVYSGELFLDKWVSVKKELAYGATLSVNLENGGDLNLTEVLGSGTLELKTGDDNVSFTISGTGVDGGIKSLPTEDPTGKGEFFNGVISFDGKFDVTLEEVVLTSVNTGADAKLTINKNVTLVQSQNSVIAGDVVFGSNGEQYYGLTVEGASEKAGYAFTPDSCGLIFEKQLHGKITVSNVGIGFTSDSELDLLIDSASKANTFYVKSESDTGAGLVGDKINITGADPSISASDYALEELNLIKTGKGEFKLTAADVKGLGALGSEDKIFGVNAGLYNVLSQRNGSINLGVEEGKMVVSGFSPEGTLSTANGIDVNLVTGRAADGLSVGELVIDSSAASGALATFANAADVKAQVFAESVSGTGNVIFSGATGTKTVVTAAQKYTGQTFVFGEVEFSGEGRNSASSLVNVSGTLSGGVVTTGRVVDYSVSAERNADDTGAAGSVTLIAVLKDARLPSNVSCYAEVEPDGTFSANVLGALPENVSVESQTYKDGAWRIVLKDGAFGESGESYTVVIPVDAKSLPGEVDAKSRFDGTAAIAGKVEIAASGKIVLDAAAGDSINVGSGEIRIAKGGDIVLANLTEETRGKVVDVAIAGSVTYGTNEENRDSADVVEAMKNGYVPGTSKLMVFTDEATGAICAQMVTDDFASLDVDYNDGISESFLDALSTIATNGRSLLDGILDADGIAKSAAKDLLFALNSLTSDGLAAEADRLSPNSFASMLAMPVSAFNSDIARIHARLDQRRYDGGNPLRESDEYEFFALAQGDFAENDNASDTPIYDYNLYGMTAGFDWKPSYETTLGFALGYTYGKAKIHNGGGKINMDEMRMTAFASHFFGDFYLEGGVQAGMSMFDTRRNSVAGTASGDTDSIFAGTFVTLGSAFVLDYDKKSGEGLYFTPSIGLSYLHSEIDGFRESGTAGLAMDDADGDSLRVRIAAGIQWEFFLSDVKMRLGAELSYAHDFLGEELDMEGRFAAGGPKFSTSGKALPTDIISVMPTLDIMLSEKSSVYLGYGIDFGTDSGVSQNINAGFRHRF